jgi:hypothetical protein
MSAAAKEHRGGRDVTLAVTSDLVLRAGAARWRVDYRDFFSRLRRDEDDFGLG